MFFNSIILTSRFILCVILKVYTTCFSWYIVMGLQKGLMPVSVYVYFFNTGEDISPSFLSGLYFRRPGLEG